MKCCLFFTTKGHCTTQGKSKDIINRTNFFEEKLSNLADANFIESVFVNSPSGDEMLTPFILDRVT